MTLPIPSGTRDVLPDEMRELRIVSARLLGTFADRGYGEVYTPALELESTLAPGDLASSRPAYRLFDEHGRVLVLRSDMTLPIARLVASRYADAEPPLRFCYLAHAYRAVRPQRGQAREMLQAGIELVGAPAPEGTAEALAVLCAALDAAGLADYRVGVGDAMLLPRLTEALGVPEAARARLLHELATRDFVGLTRVVRELDLPAEDAELLAATPQRRGAPDEALAGPADGPLGAALANLRAVVDLLPADVAARVIVDLGMLRELGYYSGAVFEVYDPALGVPIGGGGRYDDLLGRFGRPLPAVGWALNVERLHIALTGEERAGVAARPLTPATTR